MSFVILPMLMILTFAPMPGPPAAVLGDFSRLSRAINQQIALVEVDGTGHEGVLTAADSDQVTVTLGSATRTFSRANIVSAERMRDGRVDGAIKGALLGLLLSVMASQGLQSSDDAGRFVAGNVAVFSGLGYLIDAGNPNRQRLYRAPGTAVPKPSLSLSFRF